MIKLFDRSVDSVFRHWRWRSFSYWNDVKVHLVICLRHWRHVRDFGELRVDFVRTWQWFQREALELAENVIIFNVSRRSEQRRVDVVGRVRRRSSEGR